MTNLLSAENSGFEGGTIGDWTATTPRGSIQNSTTIALDGTHSLRIYWDGHGDSSAGSIGAALPDHSVGCAASTTYLFSSWWNANGGPLATLGPNIGMEVDWWTSTPSYISTADPLEIFGTTGWFQYTRILTSPSNAAYLTVRLGVGNQLQTGENYYVDRVEITEPLGWVLGAIHMAAP